MNIQKSNFILICLLFFSTSLISMDPAETRAESGSIYYSELAAKTDGQSSDLVPYELKTKSTERRVPIFQIACEDKYPADVLRALIYLGVDIKSPINEKGDTYLHYAVKLGNLAAIDILAKFIDVNARNYDGYTPLHMTKIGIESWPTIKCLLDNKADINARMPDTDNTYLHFAVVSCSNPEFITSLISRRADINAINIYGETPLLMATSTAEKVLLEQGADINAKDEDGLTCLHHACRQFGQSEVVQTILTLKADVNGGINKGQIGSTPLHVALENYDKEPSTQLSKIKLLLENGADATIENSDKKTAFKLAKHKKKALALLKEYEIKPSSPPGFLSRIFTGFASKKTEYQQLE